MEQIPNRLVRGPRERANRQRLKIPAIVSFRKKHQGVISPSIRRLSLSEIGE